MGIDCDMNERNQIQKSLSRMIPLVQNSKTGKTNLHDRKRLSHFERHELGGLSAERHKGTFWRDRKALCLDSKCGYMAVCVCQSSNCTGKTGVLYCI